MRKKKILIVGNSLQRMSIYRNIFPSDLYEIMDGIECEEVMELAFNSLNMSARARSRIIKVARTIADMELSENIEPKHLLEAIGYRSEEI